MKLEKDYGSWISLCFKFKTEVQPIWKQWVRESNYTETVSHWHHAYSRLQELHDEGIYLGGISESSIVVETTGEAGWAYFTDWSCARFASVHLKRESYIDGRAYFFRYRIPGIEDFKVIDTIALFYTFTDFVARVNNRKPNVSEWILHKIKSGLDPENIEFDGNTLTGHQ